MSTVRAGFFCFDVREYRRLSGQPQMRDIRTLRSPGAPPLESRGNRQSAG